MAVFITLVVFAFGGSLVSAWDEDPRCKRRRELRKALAANNSLSDESILHLSIPDDHQPARVGLNASISEEDASLLRGSNAEAFHRQLNNLEFSVKMHWEEGFCVSNIYCRK
jgi:hypothetical protein